MTGDCGKENTVVQEITIYDDDAPVLSPRPQNTRMPCDDVQCPELVKANDNCKGVYIAFKEERDGLFGCTNEYLLTRTWTATDRRDNKRSHRKRRTTCGQVWPTSTTPRTRTCRRRSPTPSSGSCCSLSSAA